MPRVNHVARARERDRLAVAGFGTGTADAHGNAEAHRLRLVLVRVVRVVRELRRIGLLDDVQHAHQAAVTATAADALHQQAVGALAQRLDRAAVRGRDLARIAACAATATDAHRHLPRLRTGGERAGQREAARSATAADALRHDAVREVTAGQDPARVDEPDFGAHAGHAAAAAHRKLDRALGTHAAGDRKAAVAAAAAHALREQPERARALGLDLLAGAGEIHCSGAAARAPGTAERDADLHAVGRHAAGDGEAAAAAAAAHALREQAVRCRAHGVDAARTGEVHLTARARRPAAAAHREVHRRRSADAARDAEAAVAAAAADALRQRAVGAVAGRVDRIAGRVQDDLRCA
jgi:hypothetical protein